MSLRDQFEAATAPPKTGIDTWLETLSEPDREAVREFAVNPNLSTMAFHRVLKDAGATIGKDSAAAWRRAQGYGRAR